MSGASFRMTVMALDGMPEVQAGDDLAELIVAALDRNEEHLKDGDVLVLAQKIVSKAEGRRVRLHDITPSPDAVDLASQIGKDPRLVELILAESQQVLRYRPGVLVVVHRLGYVLANAGIDASNVGPGNDGETVLLLPEDSDRSARALRESLLDRTGTRVAVIVNDSLGRAWRNGTVGVALGAAGFATRIDLRGREDRDGRALRISETGLADELAATASILMGQADESRPVVLIRGVDLPPGDGSGQDLIRPEEQDLFR